MLLVFLFIFLITTLTYFIWTPTIPFIKNQLLKISFAWLIGTTFSSFIIFFLANILTIFTTKVLFKSSLMLILVLSVITYYFFRKNILLAIKHLSKTKTTKEILPDLTAIFLCFIISISLFLPHLYENKGGQ